MTDRELLELAAKAVGANIEWRTILGNEVLRADFGYGFESWNPITDDGDAMRLAVMLKMIIDTKQGGGWPVCASADGVPWIEEHPCGDPGSATRRAIVRVAAEIGNGVRDFPTSDEIRENWI